MNDACPVNALSSDSYTPAQKRVMIARDIIAQVEARVYSAKKGIYLRPLKIETGSPDWDFGTIAQNHMPNRCDVCLVGGAVLSAIRLFNEVTYDGQNSRLHDILQKWFSRAQISLIESTFERWDVGSNPKMRAFCDKQPDAEKLMVAICRNIIRNKGTFCLPKLK